MKRIVVIAAVPSSPRTAIGCSCGRPTNRGTRSYAESGDVDDVAAIRRQGDRQATAGVTAAPDRRLRSLPWTGILVLPARLLNDPR